MDNFLHSFVCFFAGITLTNHQESECWTIVVNLALNFVHRLFPLRKKGEFKLPLLKT